MILRVMKNTMRKAAVGELRDFGLTDAEIIELRIAWALDRVIPYALDSYLDYRPELAPDLPLIADDLESAITLEEIATL